MTPAELAEIDDLIPGQMVSGAIELIKVGLEDEAPDRRDQTARACALAILAAAGLPELLELLRAARLEMGPLPDGSDRGEFHHSVLAWADRVDALLGGK